MAAVVPGAGFVLYRIFPEGLRFLGLVGPEFHQIRCSGAYDIPKGIIDAGETPLVTALREAKEEAGYTITKKQIVSGPFVDSFLTMWLAEVYTEPFITPNPHTGIIEHEGYSWLEPEELLNNCYDYLRPTVRWAVLEYLKMI